MAEASPRLQQDLSAAYLALNIPLRAPLVGPTRSETGPPSLDANFRARNRCSFLGGSELRCTSPIGGWEAGEVTGKLLPACPQPPACWAKNVGLPLMDDSENPFGLAR